ncbi:MAG TPA: aminoacyl-tRNA hydrolase [Pirellulales bacterium]|jgi:PTH1 family peptidyl-tRNA hydrolase|nr:aminoacyl-tRNA hydrolase [Pirellulales bacterium]
MKLVVGLGNPGRKYQGTRHNVGFEVLADLARRGNAGKPKANFQGEVIEATIDGQRLILLAPQTFMNRSGTSTVLARDFYKLTNENVLVVCDDFALPTGRLRLRGQGSSGGQKGLDDVIRTLGSDAVPRLRIGIGPVPAGWEPADFVLGRFAKEERETIDATVPRAADAVVSWASRGLAAAMNEFNTTSN